MKRLAVLDRYTKAKYRTEQHILRKYLFDGELGSCGICGKDYPIKFFSAAHIKKRSKCTDDEKRDLNLVMPACYFGCDSLFEKGYITVESGMVKDHSNGKSTSIKIRRYINNIVGKKCKYWTKDSKKYFIYHSKNAT